MRFLDWFTAKKSEEVEPDTRPLKRGEIKTILIELARQNTPDFEFVDYQRGWYTFHRTRRFRRYSVIELFEVGFTLKGRLLSCTVASCLNPDFLKSSWYNVGFINPRVDLIQLKRNWPSGGIPYQEAYYFHNGMLENCTRKVVEMFSDLLHHGIPFLDKQFRLLNENETLRFGFRYIEALDHKTLEELKSIVQAEKEAHREMRNRVYVELKRGMQAVPGESREFRKRLPNTALDLVELALKMHEVNSQGSNV